jgi:hypothetical protein
LKNQKPFQNFGFLQKANKPKSKKHINASLQMTCGVTKEALLKIYENNMQWICDDIGCPRNVKNTEGLIVKCNCLFFEHENEGN